LAIIESIVISRNNNIKIWVYIYYFLKLGGALGMPTFVRELDVRGNSDAQEAAIYT
jgi:hypothetical protein